MALTYEQVRTGAVNGMSAPEYRNALKDTLNQYGFSTKDNISQYMFSPGYGGISQISPQVKTAKTQRVNDLLFAMLADQQKQTSNNSNYQGQTAGPLAGAPQNMNPLPQGTASGYQPPANATNPVVNGPSWQAGPQTQALPDSSPFGQAWGGGEGTTYSPITMNEQASLLSANYRAPDQWLNGLLYDSPYQQYYGTK